jgi:hypothetical protein
MMIEVNLLLGIILTDLLLYMETLQINEKMHLLIYYAFNLFYSIIFVRVTEGN